MFDIKEVGKQVIPPTWETALESETYAEFYSKIAPPLYKDYKITVEIGHKTQQQKEPDNFVRVRLDQLIKLLKLQPANFIRFRITHPIGKHTQFCNHLGSYIIR